MKRAFVQIMLLVLISAGVLEIALGLLDPMGIRFLQALDFMHPYYTGDVSAYRLAPGTYDMVDWTATVPADGTRTIPHSGTAGCRVVIFGDSVEWGWGVNDDETFVDLLARQWPTVHMVDAGTIGYNSAQVRPAVENTPFDLGVYVITWTDAVGALPLGGQHPVGDLHRYPGIGWIHGQQSALGLYEKYLVYRLSGQIDEHAPDDMPRYFDDIDAITQHENMHVFAFEEPLGQATAARYPVTLLPLYTTTLSAADVHPDKAAHAQIADDLFRQLDETVRNLTCSSG